MPNKKPKLSSRHVNVYGKLFVSPKGVRKTINKNNPKLKRKKPLEWKEYKESIDEK